MNKQQQQKTHLDGYLKKIKPDAKVQVNSQCEDLHRQNIPILNFFGLLVKTL